MEKFLFVLFSIYRDRNDTICFNFMYTKFIDEFLKTENRQTLDFVSFSRQRNQFMYKFLKRKRNFIYLLTKII